jgi:hypothetical protein
VSEPFSILRNHVEKDYINIYKAKNINGILNFLYKPVPFCRYRRISDSEHGLAWDTSKGEISEWV